MNYHVHGVIVEFISEGPCNEGDFSEDDTNTGPQQYSAYPVRLERKRKSEMRASGM